MRARRGPSDEDMLHRYAVTAVLVASLAGAGCSPRMTKVYAAATVVTFVATAVWAVERDCGPPNICPVVDVALPVIGAGFLAGMVVSGNAGDGDAAADPPPALAAIPPGR
jgi:hypothetical protein